MSKVVYVCVCSVKDLRAGLGYRQKLFNPFKVFSFACSRLNTLQRYGISILEHIWVRLFVCHPVLPFYKYSRHDLNLNICRCMVYI
jgi:hypothetical protein